MERDARGEGRERWTGYNVVKKWIVKPGEREGKGGHVAML
jgi:hypothetical protein